MAKSSPVLTAEQRQQYQEALTADQQARDEIAAANDEAIKTALAAIINTASFKTLREKLADVQKLEGFLESRYFAHVHAVSVGAANLEVAVQ